MFFGFGARADTGFFLAGAAAGKKYLEPEPRKNGLAPQHFYPVYNLRPFLVIEAWPPWPRAAAIVEPQNSYWKPILNAFFLISELKVSRGPESEELNSTTTSSSEADYSGTASVCSEDHEDSDIIGTAERLLTREGSRKLIKPDLLAMSQLLNFDEVRDVVSAIHLTLRSLRY